MTRYYDPGYLEKIAGPAVTTGEILSKKFAKFFSNSPFFRINNLKKK